MAAVRSFPFIRCQGWSWGGGHQGLRWEEGYRMRWRGTDVAEVMSASVSYCPDWKWLEIFAQNGVKVEVKVAQLCPTLGQNTGVGSLSLLQGIFQPRDRTQVSCIGCRLILYQLSHKGSPRIMEWVAYPVSRGSTWLRNWTGVSCIASGFFTNWAIREQNEVSPDYFHLGREKLSVRYLMVKP